jgi:lysozyme family protein
MQHPAAALAGEYRSLLSMMRILPERRLQVDAVANYLLSLQAAGRYAAVSQATGVPEVWMAASFEREASSNFMRSPAQGDLWGKVSVNVPRGRGPFSSWDDAAKDAYHLDGLDAIGAANWGWARACFEGELFNGFGYRDFHHMHSPYLWGATNIQQPGKYIADGKFDPDDDDPQIGIVPMMVRMVQLRPSLRLADALNIQNDEPVAPSQIPLPALAPIGVGGGAGAQDALWIQQRLNAKGVDPQVIEDGSYGRITRQAVMAFQKMRRLTIDGFAGPKTIAALAA